MIRFRLILLAVSGLLPMLVGCASPPRRESAILGCAPERAEFAAAVQALPAAPAATGEAYWQALQQAEPNNAVVAQRLAGELTALGGAIERVDGSYKNLAACRHDRADSMRAQIAAAALDAKRGAQALADEQSAFDAELADGKAAAAQIALRQAIFEEAAERLVAAAPGSVAKVAKAVATLPQSTTPYMVTQGAEIFARPDAGSARIAELRKGQRVQGPGGGPSAGWTTLTLNDGSLGYVETAVLRAVQPNASALKAEAHAATRPTDPVVALALTARQTVPAKAQAFASRLEAAAAAFAGPASGTASSQPS